MESRIPTSSHLARHPIVSAREWEQSADSYEYQRHGRPYWIFVLDTRDTSGGAVSESEITLFLACPHCGITRAPRYCSHNLLLRYEAPPEDHYLSDICNAAQLALHGVDEERERHIQEMRQNLALMGRLERHIDVAERNWRHHTLYLENGFRQLKFGLEKLFEDFVGLIDFRIELTDSLRVLVGDPYGDGSSTNLQREQLCQSRDQTEATIRHKLLWWDNPHASTSAGHSILDQFLLRWRRSRSGRHDRWCVPWVPGPEHAPLVEHIIETLEWTGAENIVVLVFGESRPTAIDDGSAFRQVFPVYASIREAGYV